MAKYEYQVVPFIGKLKSRQPAEEVSNQLRAVINAQAGQGWEFCQLSEVNIEVSPGCLAGLLGAKASYVRFDQVVFRREAQ